MCDKGGNYYGSSLSSNDILTKPILFDDTVGDNDDDES